MKAISTGPESEAPGAEVLPSTYGTAFGYPRDFLGNRFVYAVISPRAHGLSVGVNMNPDKYCNFDCIYCEVKRLEPSLESRLDVAAMITELDRTLMLVRSGGMGGGSRFRNVPPDLLKLRHVTLSGDGEPTLCPNFSEGVEAVVHLRSRGLSPFFKLVLLTNASGLDRPEVADGLSQLTPRDEIWAKLEAGTQEYMDRINRPNCSLDRILENILHLARQRPLVIQSLFASMENVGPPASEIEAYVERLRQLKNDGAQIQLVQIYSAIRPTAHPECGHLPLRTLSAIAQRVREVTGLKVEVF